MMPEVCSTEETLRIADHFNKKVVMQSWTKFTHYPQSETGTLATHSGKTRCQLPEFQVLGFRFCQTISLNHTKPKSMLKSFVSHPKHHL